MLDTLTEDLSVGGLRFRAPEPLSPGAELALGVQLGNTRIALQGQVVRAQQDVFGASVAVAFERMSDSTSSDLSRYITACQRQRLPWVTDTYRVRCELDARRQLVRGTTMGCSPRYLEVLLDQPVPPTERVTIAVTVDDLVAVVRGVVITGCGDSDKWQTCVEIDDPPPARWSELLEQRHTSVRKS